MIKCINTYQIPHNGDSYFQSSMRTQGTVLTSQKSGFNEEFTNTHMKIIEQERM